MNRRGVTLIELLVVIAIIGILAVALGFSYVGWMGAYKVESVTKDVYTRIQTARSLAVQRNHRYYMLFNGDNTIWLTEDSNDNGAFEEGPIAGYPTPAYEYTMMSLMAGNFITFNVRGMPEDNTGTLRVNTTVDADYDCIILEATRTTMGKWGVPTAGVCNAK